MTVDSGRSGADAPSGCQPSASAAISVASSRSGIPNAPWWRCLHCGCDEYEEHVFTGHMKGVAMVRCANCQVLHSPPDPNSPQALRWQVKYLLGALQNIVDGDIPRPRAKQWRDDGKPSKADKCPHDRWMYEECSECIGEFAASAIEAATAGETVKQGSTEGESAVAESQTPNSSGDRV